MLLLPRGACAVLRYDGGPDAAGVAWEGAGAGRTVVLGFPFETVTDPVRREAPGGRRAGVSARVGHANEP